MDRIPHLIPTPTPNPDPAPSHSLTIRCSFLGWSGGTSWSTHIRHCDVDMTSLIRCPPLPMTQPTTPGIRSTTVVCWGHKLGET